VERVVIGDVAARRFDNRPVYRPVSARSKPVCQFQSVLIIVVPIHAASRGGCTLAGCRELATDARRTIKIDLERVQLSLFGH